MTDRIAGLTTHARTLRDITMKQVDLAKINQQTSSGIKVATFSELNGAVERVSANQSKMSRLDNYVSNNKAVTATLNAMDTSLTQIQKALEDFSSNLVLRRGATTSDQMNFKALTQEALDKITGSLNLNIGGRYIFSGTKTDVKPVDNQIYLNQSGTPDSSYYNGNSEPMTARISDTRTIDYGIPGNDPAFQKALAAIVTAKNADDNNDDAGFQEAMDLLNAALADVTNLRAKVATNSVSVESANTEHASMKIYWKAAVADDLETDIAEASIKLAADQTILQATYQVFALTSKLKLSDYL